MLDAVKKTSKFIDSVSAKTARGLHWLLLLMIATAVYNAFGRYAGKWVGINLSSNFFIELQWYLFSLVFLFGASSALLRKAHVSVDVLSSRFSENFRAKISIAGGVLLLLPFCIFMIVISIPSVQSSWAVFEDSPDPGGIVRYPIKTMVPLAFFLLLLQGISELIKTWLFLRKEEAAKEEDRSVSGGL
ncbi:MAG: TRAP transporter small permease subunit [Spirochaetia bacterium]|nr:TRAP transporter small permease subunit [Spirochaetia bacterium]